MLGIYVVVRLAGSCWQLLAAGRKEFTIRGRQAQISGDARQDLVRVARRHAWEMQNFAARHRALWIRSKWRNGRTGVPLNLETYLFFLCRFLPAQALQGLEETYENKSLCGWQRSSLGTQPETYPKACDQTGRLIVIYTFFPNLYNCISKSLKHESPIGNMSEIAQ